VAILCTVWVCAAGWAQDREIEVDVELEYGLKAQYIERFTRFVVWPEDSSVSDSSQPFIIAVVGKNPFDPFLKELAAGRQIKGKPIEIWEVSEIGLLVDPQVVFISRSEEAQLDAILEWTRGKPVLTIGDTAGFADRGVHINFFREGDHIRFEVNPAAAKESRLEPSSKLLRLARIVGPVVER
jgi:hypothetical protein